MAALLHVPLRRGLPIALVMAAALPLAYAGRWTQWLGVWSETQNHIGAAFIFAIPAAAGIGAWIGAGNQRGGLHELQRGASRGPAIVAVREYVEPAVWTVLGYALGSLPALVATAFTAETGRPHLLPMLAQMACVAGATATGHLVGSRIPWFLGAPVCAAVAYISLGFLSFNADSLLVVLTPLDERWMTFHSILWWVFLLQIALWALLFANAVARRAQQPKAALLALFLAGVAAAPLLYVTPSTRTVSASAVDISCVEQRDTALCLPKAKGLLEPDLLRELDRARQVLIGLLPDDVAFIDDEARGISAAADQSIENVARTQSEAGRSLVYFSQAGDLSGATRLDSEQFHYALIAFMVPPSPTPAGPQDEMDADTFPLIPLASPTDVIHRWYLRTLEISTDGTGGPGAPYLDEGQLDYRPHASAVEAFDSMTNTQRGEWFAQNAAAIKGGTLNWSTLEQIPQ